MDNTTKLILNYLNFTTNANRQGLIQYLVRYSTKRLRETEIIARLMVLQHYLEEYEEYEKCQSIKTILNQYLNETKNT